MFIIPPPPDINCFSKASWQGLRTHGRGLRNGEGIQKNDFVNSASCVKGLCSDLKAYQSQMTFRFTIGSADDKVLGWWEPGASKFKERLASLKHAHGKGFATSVSCEPMLDLNIGAVVDVVRPFVTDSIWLGRANRLMSTLSLNCPCDHQASWYGKKLLAGQSDDYLRSLYKRFKDDPLIRFKDSIKKVVGVARPTEKGLDI